jgi:hypothetical protein
VLLPLIFNNVCAIQLQFLLFLSSLYIIWYAQVQPHSIRMLGRIELLNESVIMVLCYLLLTFTLFNNDTQVQFQTGYVFVALIFVILMVNMLRIFYNTDL